MGRKGKSSMCIMYILWPEQHVHHLHMHVHVNVHVYVHVHHVHPPAWNHETLLGGH